MIARGIIHAAAAACRARLRGLVPAVAVLLLAAVVSSGAVAQPRKAVWIAAVETNLGINVVRDDGRVVSYWDVSSAEGPRVIPGLENIVATTARLALRRDGVVLTWQPKCVGGEDPNCEFPPARPVAGLRNVVTISEYRGCYLALDREGTVWGWGDDSNGLISGQPAVDQPLGKPYKRRLVNAPTRVPLPVPMASISAGAAQGGAIDRDRRAWTWGGGSSAEFLQGPGEDIRGSNGFVARRITGLPPVRALDTRTTAYAITLTGELWRWGVSQVNGMRGSTTPSKVEGVTNVAAISHTGFFTAIMDGFGIVRFIGLAPDHDHGGKFIDEPHASKPMPRATFISGNARITTDGSVLFFPFGSNGAVRRLELGGNDNG